MKKITILLLCLLFVGCSNQTTDINNATLTINKSSIKDFRLNNQNFLNDLKDKVYDSIWSKDKKETKEYFLKNVNLDELQDKEYYTNVKKMYLLYMQGNTDDKSINEEKFNLLNTELEELVEKVNLDTGYNK